MKYWRHQYNFFLSTPTYCSSPPLSTRTEKILAPCLCDEGGALINKVCMSSGFPPWIVGELSWVMWKHSCHPNRVWWGDADSRFKGSVLLCGVDSVSFCFILSCCAVVFQALPVRCVPCSLHVWSGSSRSSLYPLGKQIYRHENTAITVTNRPKIERAGNQSHCICFQMSHRLPVCPKGSTANTSRIYLQAGRNFNCYTFGRCPFSSTHTELHRVCMQQL